MGAALPDTVMSNSDFRPFALRIYGAEGVSQAALTLQVQAGVDVPVLLLAAYVGAVQARSFEAADVAVVQRRVGAWHAEIVRPLRAVRTRLKAGPPPAPDSVTARLREGVKKLELEAELIELDQLALVAHDLDRSVSQGSGMERAASAMAVVVLDSAGRPPTPTEARAIDVIATAAAADSELS